MVTKKRKLAFFLIAIFLFSLPSNKVQAIGGSKNTAVLSCIICSIMGAPLILGGILTIQDNKIQGTLMIGTGGLAILLGSTIALCLCLSERSKRRVDNAYA